MLDMFAPLTEQELSSAPSVPTEIPIQVISPVPEGASQPEFHHPAYGKASKVWAYLDENSQLVGYMLRFDYADSKGGIGKEYLPYSWCDTTNGPQWRFAGFASPYPLYRLPEILSNRDATVLVCEGEKTADAAQRLFPGMVTTTSAFGAWMADSTDWTPLRNRRIIIAPDLDDAGEQYVEDVIQLLFKVGAASVEILSVRKLARFEWHGEKRLRRTSTPEGWDLANAVREGWDSERLQLAIAEFGCVTAPPRPISVKPETAVKFRLTPEGIEALIPEKARGDIVGYSWGWICGPLELVAMARDGNSMDWGKLLKVTDPDGKESEVFISDEMLAGDGAECRRVLQGAGLRIAASKEERDALKDYLSRMNSEARATTVYRTGWHDECFVTSGKIVGSLNGGERIVMRGVSQSRAGHMRGTLEGWKSQIARFAVGNSRLAFALSTAFAPALLKLTGAESGGFHLVGASSIGKSTALVIAGSVWGGGGKGGYLRPWRATANGLEGIAEAHCDALLCLDEMGQVRGIEAGAAAYMLANGIGKVRANRNGDARSPKEWRVIVFSTGEITLADKISEEGGHNRAVAGQQTRFVDIPAAPTGFDTLIESSHEFSDTGKLAQHLKIGASEHYGHAWEPFVRHVALEGQNVLLKVKLLQDEFVGDVLSGISVDGQVSRVAGRFGLVAASGEIATEIGILPWPTGEATRSAKKCFADWLDQRQTTGSLEEEDAVSCIRAFIEKHGSSRFAQGPEESIGVAEVRMSEKVAGRVGVVQVPRGGLPQYCFFQEAWKDVCQGRNPKQVAAALKRRGFLVSQKDRLTYPVRIKTSEGGNSITRQSRMYVVRESIIHEPLPPADPVEAIQNSEMLFPNKNS
jgi:uncharacterized protein (DUF927 family)